MTASREGPALYAIDGSGDLAPTCRGCKHLRVHDFHYFYCTDLKGEKTYFGDSWRRLYRYPTPDEECRFPCHPLETAP